MEGNSSLSRKAKEMIMDTDIIKFISMTSLWEIAIKAGINKLKLEIPFCDLKKEIQINGFEILPIEMEHIQELFKLDFHHRDPFDRLIIAQAAKEKMTVITKDESFKKYSEIVLCW